MSRVSDYEVERWLVWARNYGEIEQFKKVKGSARKWLVTLPDPPGVRPITASGMEPGMIERCIVPEEFVLTSREAIAFGYGCAIAGARPETRPALAAREWNW